MLSSSDETTLTPLLEQNIPCARTVDRWTFLLGSVFGVFLHLSLLGVNFMYWWSFESLTPAHKAELALSIVWTTVWALVISCLAVLFLWSLSKLVSALCPEVPHEFLLSIESTFAFGCLGSLFVLEVVYTTFQVSLGAGNGNFALFLAMVCSFGVGGTVHLRSLMFEKNTETTEDKTIDQLDV